MEAQKGSIFYLRLTAGTDPMPFARQLGSLLSIDADLPAPAA